MNTAKRRIGGLGRVSRVLVGLGFLYLAVTGGRLGLFYLAQTHGGFSWQLSWQDAALGLIVFPAVMVAAGLAARRFAGRPVRFTGPLGVAVNTPGIRLPVTTPENPGGAWPFYRTTLLGHACR